MYRPPPKVTLSDTPLPYTTRFRSAAIEALAMGASDIMAKPGRSVFGGQFPDLLIERLLKLGTQARWQSAPSDAPPVALRKIESRTALACIGIGASTEEIGRAHV